MATLDEARTKLASAEAAYEAAMTDQAHAITSPSGGRSKTRPLLDSLLNAVKYWRKEVARLERAQSTGGIRVRGVTPL